MQVYGEPINRRACSAITFHHNTILHLVIHLRLPGLSADKLVGQAVIDDSVPRGLSAADHRAQTAEVPKMDLGRGPSFSWALEGGGGAVHDTIVAAEEPRH